VQPNFDRSTGFLNSECLITYTNLREHLRRPRIQAQDFEALPVLNSTSPDEAVLPRRSAPNGKIWFSVLSHAS